MLKFAYTYPPIIKSFFQILFYLNLGEVFRQYFLDQIRPLDQANPFAVDIILITDLVHLFHITDPVNIK